MMPHAERRLTSRGCDRTKKLRQTVNRGSVYNEWHSATSVLGPEDTNLARYRLEGVLSGRVRSLQRRIVQAVQAGAWRKVKRLRYLLAHSFAARALAVRRVTENKGKKTPGVDGELWETPEKKAAAVERIGRWRG